jgi:hypothetical protein
MPYAKIFLWLTICSMLQGKGPKSKNPPNLDSKKLNKYSSFTDYGKV